MIGFIADLLWPRICPICNNVCDRKGHHICTDCLMRLPHIPVVGLCRQCGRDIPSQRFEFLCDDCSCHHPSFDRAVSALRFEGDARKLIHAFKFDEKIYLRNDLVDILESAVRLRFKLDAIDCVSSVPLAWLRRWTRGYNQCELLASELARRLNLPYKSLLRRVGNPRQQGKLNEEARRKNVVGSFALARFADLSKISTVLLIDDIMTTGSTLSEAARILKSGGVKNVYAASLARSIRA